MAHPTRGHRSGTYEIQEIIAVDTDRLTITYRHAGSYQPTQLRLTAPNTPAARQLLEAMATSVKVAPGADRYSAWESAATLDRAAYYSKRMLESLADAGFEDLSDPRLTITALDEAHAQLTGHNRRTAHHLLARAVEAVHPNGRAMALAMRRHRFTVTPTNPTTYDDATADAIESAARKVFMAALTAQRDIFRELGHDVTNKDWLSIPATEVRDALRENHPGVFTETNPPHPGAPRSELIAWVLAHPERFGLASYQKRRRLHHSIEKIAAAVYPGNSVLTAALIVQTLGDNSGFNLSTMLETNALSLDRLGPSTALLFTTKARNHTEGWIPTGTRSIFSPGGLVATLTSLTRFSRQHRLDMLGPSSPITNRLYVEHFCDPTSAELLNGRRRVNAWRGADFQAAWPEEGPLKSNTTLRFPDLRLVAQRRAMKEGLNADVHGHSPTTKVHYLAHVLPRHVLAKHASEAQDEFHTTAVSRFEHVSMATDGPAQELAQVSAERLMDVEIGVCANAGESPEKPGVPCALGITQCFICPHGYRTADHIPGLLAAVQVADIIEANAAEEWANGEAPLLRTFAKATLAQFPKPVVASIRRTTDLTGHVLTIFGLYQQLRHSERKHDG